MSGSDRSEYWNSFYTRQVVGDLSVPSQFAAFIANELRSVQGVIDVACGSGRDSFFFARYFSEVVGIDQSKAAVMRCRELSTAHDIQNLRFEKTSATDEHLVSSIHDLRRRSGGPVLVYARFFLHAINDDEEAVFFDRVSEGLNQGDYFSIEYRTVRDASNVKSTPDHFRRFVQPSKVLSALDARNFTVEYSVEGFGLAKYKQDDAYVARSIHRKV